MRKTLLATAVLLGLGFALPAMADHNYNNDNTLTYTNSSTHTDSSTHTKTVTKTNSGDDRNNSGDSSSIGVGSGRRQQWRDGYRVGQRFVRYQQGGRGKQP
ncbi:hypothetical protein [Rhodanobacter umsongensis]